MKKRINRKDLIGKTFGRLTVLAAYAAIDGGRTVCDCVCSCGVEKTIEAHSVVSGHTVSCGCKAKENLINLVKRKKKNTEQFVKEASALHNNKYDYSKTNYVGAHDKVIIICNDHGEFEQTPRNHLFGKRGRGQGCRKCGMIECSAATRLTNECIDQFVIDNNIQVKRLGDYINSGIKIKWQCLKCPNIWDVSPTCIKSGVGCPKCNDTILTNEYVDKFLIDNSLQFKRVGNYINAYTKIDWECFKCNNIWSAKPGEIIRRGNTKKGGGSGCPNCSKYKNERLVGSTLRSFNSKIEKLMIVLPTGQKMFPDFYLPELNLIIEYNGIQHYKPTCFGNMSEDDAKDSFKRQQDRDQLLRDYCKEKNIKLLEIDGRVYKGENLKQFVLGCFDNGAYNG